MSLFWTIGLLETFGHLHLREKQLRIIPSIAVRGGLVHGVRRRNMLIFGVAKVVNVELVVPVGHHGLMVVGPTLTIGLRRMFAIGTKNLDIMHSNDRRETAIVSIGIAERLARIVNLPGIQQSVKNGFISLEDGAVLVQIWDADLIGDIFESHKVLGEMGTKILQTITVVVDKPTILYLHCRWTLHHLASKRF